MSSETGWKRLDEVFARWRKMNQDARDSEERWERENAQVWADWQAARTEDRARAEIRASIELAENNMVVAGVTKRAIASWKWGLESWPATEAVRTWMGSKKTFLLLVGSTGTGKSVATTEAIAVRGGLFVRAVEMARLSSFDPTDKARLADIHNARCLVLDDLGTELAHDGWRPMFDELVDIRAGAYAPTILTSNLDNKTMRARYGDRVMDRIRDDGLIAFCGDKSRRGGGP